MSEFTPPTDQVRSRYAYDPEGEYRDPINAASNERASKRAFDRWLESVKREAAAVALEEFAEKWAEQDGIEALMFADDDVSAVLLTEKALIARAAEYRTTRTPGEETTP